MSPRFGCEERQAEYRVTRRLRLGDLRACNADRSPSALPFDSI